MPIAVPSDKVACRVCAHRAKRMLRVCASQIIVGYWNIRGLAAAIRMMCEYAGAAYTSKEYAVGTKEDGG